MIRKICRAFLLGVTMLALVPPAAAVDYALPDLRGEVQSLNQYHGKWVVVSYWASWCSTCMEEMPSLKALHSDNRDGDIVVVGINFEDINVTQLQAVVEEQALPYPVWRSKPVANTPLGPVPALPATYIVDPQGNTVAGQVGIVTQQQIEDYIRRKQAERD